MKIAHYAFLSFIPIKMEQLCLSHEKIPIKYCKNLPKKQCDAGYPQKTHGTGLAREMTLAVAPVRFNAAP